MSHRVPQVHNGRGVVVSLQFILRGKHASDEVAFTFFSIINYFTNLVECILSCLLFSASAHLILLMICQYLKDVWWISFFPQKLDQVLGSENF
jgi:hypothetical protein